jgi:hypothetical protein
VSPLALGPFVVRAEAAATEAFAHETRGGAARVPFTFPVRWLTHPEIRAAAARMIDEAAWIPLHESQSFDYKNSLERDVDYRMKVVMLREAKPSRIILRADIATIADEPCLSMEMTLRIVATPAMHDGAPDEHAG